MKVTMQHTVDLHEVPLRIDNIVQDCATQLTTISNIIKSINCLHPEKFTSQIDFVRKKMFAVDNQMGECASLMQGYQEALTMSADKDSASENSEMHPDMPTEITEETHKRMRDLMQQLDKGTDE